VIATLAALFLFASAHTAAEAGAAQVSVEPTSQLRAEPTPPSARRTLALTLPDATFTAGAVERPSGAPACSADVCQPRVDVPGHAPRFTDRRQELFLALLQRTPFRPIAVLASAIASTGLSVDFRPAKLDTGGLSHGHEGWGKIFIEFRIRLDATNLPVME
jgi:hypothetical protein